MSQMTQETIHASPILVVEDNEMNRMFLVSALAAQGFRNVRALENANELMVQIENFRPDLIILDVMMPGMDGFNACRAIREKSHHRELPILIQTMLTEPNSRVKAFESGATDFVSKPVYPEELGARVRIHLEKRLYLKGIELYKDRIESELNTARQLQSSILPENETLAELKQRCGLDIASHYQPSSELGGDFWGLKNFFSHQVGMWMVDFSGHGVAAALNAFRLQAYLNEILPVASRPGEYLSYLNDKLLNLFLRGQFATMFYGILDMREHQLFYATACSPHPILLRGDTDEAEMIDGSGSPLGINMQLYETKNILFRPGDSLLLYSDVLTETPDKNGNYFSETEIMEVLKAHKDSSAYEMQSRLLEAFKQHCGKSHLSDDLTLSLWKRTQ